MTTMTTKDLIDRLIGGTITPTELQTLTAEIGPEAVRRIMQSERHLRAGMERATRVSTSPSFMVGLMSTLRALPRPPRWMRLLWRWSLPAGVLLALLGISTLVLLLPKPSANTSATTSTWDELLLSAFLSSSTSAWMEVSPNALIVAAIVLLAMIVALRLDTSRR